VNCLICNEDLDEVNWYAGTHPMCETLERDPLADEIQAELTSIIKWADENSPRSQQTALGPSEIGTPCERRLAYRLANLPPVNFNRDPWPAIVGTAIHQWLEGAVNRYGDPRLETEAELIIDQALTGHSDLLRETTVVDYKTAGTDVMREARKNGPSRSYKIQINLYGLGQVRRGRRIEHVALVYLPRAGNLSGMYVWVDKFRPEVAGAALERMYGIANGLIEVDIFNHPEIFNEIPAVADHCGFCPYYRKEGLMANGIADETGCPGA
jgi:hypothetical protein